MVRVLDRIRFGLMDADGDGDNPLLGEFEWFAREYPRCYRHHLECAQFRLCTIHALYVQIHWELAPRLNASPNSLGCSTGDERVKRIYWEFESYLAAISSSLDLLARIAGLVYPRQTPPNFNRFCKMPEKSKMLTIMQLAQSRWAFRLKGYRDCFTHFTPVDTLLSAGLTRYQDGFHIRAKLPTNPGVREILGFRYSRRAEVLRYASTTWRHMMALDRAVAKEIGSAYASGNYPQRTTGLFFVN